MPGVNPPINERLLAIVGDLYNRMQAVETQQQQTITDSQGRPLINFGLVPGSNPARYGIQFLDSTTGTEQLFIGEQASGSGVMIIIGSSGVLESANYSPGASGFKLTPDGNAEFNQLTLRNGIIGDDALTNPVLTDAQNDVASGFTWTTSSVARASVTFTVPAGFTTANVLAVGHNGTTVAGSPTGAIYLSTAVAIDGDGSSSAESTLMTSGGGVTVPAGWAKKVTGLSGGDMFDVITYGLYTSASGGSVPASGTGNSRVSAIVTYTR